ncbi:hypothetical protein WBJ53_14865 [Spirosoma sp. SC4-14]|uniref:hypothetical protein n=1 Tax=Spirosoma sp. SC4-14 TaxID=3128900 RepID=UPI0030D59B7E
MNPNQRAQLAAKIRNHLAELNALLEEAHYNHLLIDISQDDTPGEWLHENKKPVRLSIRILDTITREL